MATMEELADKVAHATTGKDVRGAIAEGFGQFDQVKGEVFRRVKAVEDDNTALNQRVDNLGAEDKNLQSQIDDKASIEDLNDAKAEWLTRAKHIALGTDYETVEQAVMQILKEKGMI